MGSALLYRSAAVLRCFVVGGLLLGALVWDGAAVRVTAATPTATEFAPLKSHRIVFLGDSNTHAGYYITWLEAQLCAAGLDPCPELINLGLPSETCSGLSEPDHPFPRPNVHERLSRVLRMAKPDLVVVCYGMNDGIYYPFGDDRFMAYQEGIQQIVDQVHAAGAKIILMTPPAFDPLPMRREGKLRGEGEDRYAWFAAYADYDQVLERYSRWILAQKDRVDMVIDIHTPLNDFLQAQRASNPDYTMSGDGVHFNPQGHIVVAREILKAWGVTPREDLPDGLLQLVAQRQQVLHDAWLSHVGHQRPGMQAGLPLPQAQAKAEEIDRQLQSLGISP